MIPSVKTRRTKLPICFYLVACVVHLHFNFTCFLWQNANTFLYPDQGNDLSYRVCEVFAFHLFWIISGLLFMMPVKVQSVKLTHLTYKVLPRGDLAITAREQLPQNHQMRRASYNFQLYYCCYAQHFSSCFFQTLVGRFFFLRLQYF